MKSATAFLPMSSASIRSLAMPGLADTPKDKKYSSLSSKLELKGLVKPKTDSSTHCTLHLSRLNISFQCIEELFQYIELGCDESYTIPSVVRSVVLVAEAYNTSILFA